MLVKGATRRQHCAELSGYCVMRHCIHIAIGCSLVKVIVNETLRIGQDTEGEARILSGLRWPADNIADWPAINLILIPTDPLNLCSGRDPSVSWQLIEHANLEVCKNCFNIYSVSLTAMLDLKLLVTHWYCLIIQSLIEEFSIGTSDVLP